MDNIKSIQLKIISIAITIACATWIIDSAVDSFLYYDEEFLDSLVLDVSAFEWYIRSFFGGCIIIAGLTIANFTSKQKKLEKTTADSENRYLSLVESTDDSIYLVDKDCNYLYMNRKHRGRLGIQGDQFRERSYREFHAPHETQWFMKKIDKVFTSGISTQYEYKSLRDGKHFLQTFSPVKNSKGDITAVTIVSKDITLLKEVEEKLRTLSLTDSLTGLYNRRGFFTLADQQLKLSDRQKKGMILISADLDYLKRINDDLGHQEGDKILIETAFILRQTFRESDIIARVGGDEFVILASETPSDNFTALITRLNTNIDSYNKASEKNYKLSLSIGIAHYKSGSHRTIDELLSEADGLMYEQKNQKR
jgi:diguanylate cyclase (GGDEF)-like protein/PAS domain S-box-containing protein